MSQPLSPQEIQHLQYLLARGQHAGQVRHPGAPGPGMMASLNPPSTRKRIWEGVEYEPTGLYEPKPLMPYADNIGWVPRDRTATFTNPTVGQESALTLGFSTPSVCYALTGSAIPSDGTTGLPVGYNPLDTFRVQVKYSQGDLWQTDPTLARNVLGTAEFPRLVGARAWRLDAGTSLRLTVTPLVANLTIDVTLWIIETPGSNIAPS